MMLLTKKSCVEHETMKYWVFRTCLESAFENYNAMRGEPVPNLRACPVFDQGMIGRFLGVPKRFFGLDDAVCFDAYVGFADVADSTTADVYHRRFSFRFISM